MIERKKYLEKLISKKGNGLVKVITGIRRSGKSYLLFNIYLNPQNKPSKKPTQRAKNIV